MEPKLLVDRIRNALERMRAEIAPEYYNIEWPALLRAMHSTIPHLLAQVEGSLSNLD